MSQMGKGAWDQDSEGQWKEKRGPLETSQLAYDLAKVVCDWLPNNVSCDTMCVTLETNHIKFLPLAWWVQTY